MVVDGVEHAARLRCARKLQKRLAGTVDRPHTYLVFYHTVRETAKQSIRTQSAHKVVGEEVYLELAV